MLKVKKHRNWLKDEEEMGFGVFEAENSYSCSMPGRIDNYSGLKSEKILSYRNCKPIQYLICLDWKPVQIDAVWTEKL